MAPPVLSRMQAEDHDQSTGGYCGESRQLAEGCGSFGRAELRRSVPGWPLTFLGRLNQLVHDPDELFRQKWLLKELDNAFKFPLHIT